MYLSNNKYFLNLELIKNLWEKRITMITPKEIENKTMSPEKRASAKNDYFAFYIGRPISYIITIPFLYSDIRPDTVSTISIVPIIVGFIIMSIGKSKGNLVIGWICFFIWNLLDGVDGNIARYKHQFSRMGSVYAAMSGYIAMILSFFAWGIAAAHNPGILQSYFNISSELYIIIGALSGIFVIFPRFIMHKAITTLKNPNAMNEVKDKSEYGTLKIIALNLTSISGFVQVLMLVAILLNMLDLFTVCYFMLNLVVMLISLKNIFD